MKKDVFSSRFALFLPLLIATGCHPRSGPTDGGATPTQAPYDAGQTAALQLHIEIGESDGGLVRALLDPATPAVVPVTRALDVTASLPLHNYRLRIFDEIDRALPSDDTPELTPSGLRYHVSLVAPLRAGHRYTLLLDAQSGTTFDDGSGAELNEQRFEFRTEGDREKDVPAKRNQTSRHRRGT
ncbi:MAG: hypothetical protein ACLQIH_13195 [Myxococcaceae bacterium]